MPDPVVISMKDLAAMKGRKQVGEDRKTYDRPIRLVYDKPWVGAEADILDRVSEEDGLPEQGDPLVEGDSRLLKTLDVISLGSAQEFLVLCRYETPGPLSNWGISPLAMKDRVYGGGTNPRRVPYYMDYSDTPQPSLNTAGELMNPMPTRTESEFSITIEGNRSAYDWATYAQYLKPHSINDEAVVVRGETFAAGTMKLVDITFNPESQNGVDFYVVKWEILIAQTWEDEIESRGFNELPLFSDLLRPIVVGEPPAPTSFAWPLDENGVREADPTTSPYLLPRNPQPRRDFSVFDWTATA